MSSNLSFEAKLERLSAINSALAEGGVSLADSVALFKEGTALIGELTELLNAAELEITELSTGAEEG